jgi:HSP20 family molecular chaperone IbpA
MAQEKVAPTIEEPVNKTLVDDAIASMEKLYETLTGSPPADGDSTRTPIPVERDPGDFVSERLERLVHALGQPLPATGREWSPPIVVWESPQEIVACVDLPGIKRADVEVVDEGDALTVRGELKAAHDGLKLQFAERPLGRFRRQILLPRRARASAVKARLVDGVLEIRIPRESGSSAGGRKIEIT